MTAPAAVLLLLAAGALALPALHTDYTYQDDIESETPEEEVVLAPKRAALVLDRVLVALQRALQRDSAGGAGAEEAGGPRALQLRAPQYAGDVRALQRRGPSVPGRGRVLRCYFNAITCF